ncbi:hypothetical protein PILCRDRAFT_14389 [Piloderma croceum F 1598]|uniref:WAP domain-containing protein n=1 Tax=Piloderma croceum (strain F 1598) TaxID=765440 RepID=A0A0C3F344_PILCF|nr:hypothetical protein PILCRDRAFT_14389 [Piloderma croceum F 1598]
MRFNSGIMVLLSVLATTALARPAGDSAPDASAEPRATSAPPSGTDCAPIGSDCDPLTGKTCCTGVCALSLIRDKTCVPTPQM